MSNVFKIKLTTISPVHIGCQYNISPYSDYIYKEGKIYFIDENKLINFFRSSENMDKLMEEYLDIIKAQASSNIEDKHNLEDFFDKYGLELKEFSICSLPTNGRITQNINKTVNTSGRPYIPGSSLKGAIRTCLLYHHIKPQDNNITSTSEGNIFGRYGNDILKNLLISDTNTTTIDDLIILRTARYNLAKKSEDAPAIFESINKGVDLEFKIKTKPVLDKKFDYFESDNISEIFSIINKFYRDTIDRELKILQENNHPMITKIVSFYHELKKEINLAEDKDSTAIMRIGAGKTFFENTIGLALEKSELEQIIARLGREQRKTNKNFFPKTRTTVGYGGNLDQVLGWVKISLK